MTARCFARRSNCSRSRDDGQGRQAACCRTANLSKIEFLLDEPSFQPHHATFIKNLGLLGIDASSAADRCRAIPGARRGFDFDITIERLSMSATPGDSLRPYFSPRRPPPPRAHIILPASRAPLSMRWSRRRSAHIASGSDVACRALDRVFRAGRYWIPQWYRSTHPLAYWDVFSHPAKLPRYAQGTGAPENWWYDAAKAAKLEQAK